ncbi:hypothetical protein GCM10027395_02630 [Giesbergeria sinuosa]
MFYGAIRKTLCAPHREVPVAKRLPDGPSKRGGGARLHAAGWLGSYISITSKLSKVEGSAARYARHFWPVVR